MDKMVPDFEDTCGNEAIQLTGADETFSDNEGRS